MVGTPAAYSSAMGPVRRTYRTVGRIMGRVIIAGMVKPRSNGASVPRVIVGAAVFAIGLFAGRRHRDVGRAAILMAR
jgi:hypothetical protein